MGAEGRGLHEKVTSVEDKINSSLVKKIRYIASIRNKVLHEDGFELDSKTLSSFEFACDQVESALSHHRSPSSGKSTSEGIDFVKEFKNASPLRKAGIVGAAIAALVFLNR